MGFVRHLNQFEGMHVFVIAFWRNLLSLVFFLPFFVQARVSVLVSDHHVMLFWRALLMVISGTAMFFAATLMPIPEATAISFTTPLFCVILAVIFLKEHIDLRRSVALAGGLLGVIIILRPGAAVFDWAALLPILSAATFGGVIVLGRVLAAFESAEKIAVYIGLRSVPLSLVPALWFWQWPNGEQFLWLLATGGAAGLNMYSISRALRIGQASQTAPWDFVRLPFVAALAYVWFDQRSDLWTWAGAAVIFGSVVFVTWRESQIARRTERQAR